MNIYDVEQYIKEHGNGCILIDNKYINNKTKMKFKCLCGSIFETTFDKFKNRNKKQCNSCSRKNAIDITSKKEIIECDNCGTVFKQKRDVIYKNKHNYCSRKCKDAHHLDGYNWCIDKRTSVDNGITLCKKCHNEFHNIYGRGNNTENQFKEFISKKSINMPINYQAVESKLK